ncbi:MAG: hypothetical protein AAF737_03745 [Pseudomonadota bacterium]
MNTTSDYTVVKRSGKPPLRFHGEMVASETSYRMGPELWFEVGVHRRPKGGYVVEVKCFQKSEAYADRFVGQQCNNVAEVLDFLEAYDVGDDLACDASATAGSSAAQLALAELRLRRRIAIAQREFQVAATPILEELGKWTRRTKRQPVSLGV